MVPRPPGMTGFGLGQGRHREVRKYIDAYTGAAALWKIKSTWVAQSGGCLTLNLSSGLDVMVVGWSPTLGSTLGMEPTKNRKTNKLTKNNKTLGSWVNHEVLTW